MGCGEFLVKYILFFANLVFALAGLALLGLGIAAQLQIKQIVDIADASFQVAPITSMVVGSIVFLIAFFGCCGAIRESNCMLVTYSICMLILMAIKLTLAILIFVKLDNITSEIPRWLNEAFANNRDNFHNIEKAFSCCGPSGPLAYGVSLITLPASCCPSSPCVVTSAYPGCNGVVQEFFNTFGMAIGIVAIVVVAIEDPIKLRDKKLPFFRDIRLLIRRTSMITPVQGAIIRMNAAGRQHVIKYRKKRVGDRMQYCTGSVSGFILQPWSRELAAKRLVLVGYDLLQLVAAVFGLCLANHARNKSRRARY